MNDPDRLSISRGSFSLRNRKSVPGIVPWTAQQRRLSMAINTDLIKKSVDLLAPKGTQITEYFYNYMFQHHPEVRPMFPKDMGPQAKRLLDSIVYIATNIDRAESLVPYLQKLGVGHNKYNTKPEHYPIVGESLLKTLEHFAGAAWTPELAQSWTEAYGIAANVMIEAAKKAAA